MQNLSQHSLEKQIENLEKRIEILEKQRGQNLVPFVFRNSVRCASPNLTLKLQSLNDFQSSTNLKEIPEISHQLSIIAKNKFKYTRLFRVFPNYYKVDLQTRCNWLAAPSTHYLCKTLVLYNKGKASKSSQALKYNIIFVVVPYESQGFTTSTINHTIHKLVLKDFPNFHCTSRHFVYRFLDSEKATLLTGYKSGGMSPIGSLTKYPILLDKRIQELPIPYFYLGAGHVDLKIGIPLAEFHRVYFPIVVDLEQPQQVSTLT